MKPLFTLLIATAVLHTAAYAQQSSRLIAIHNARGNSGVFQPTDSGRLVYNGPRSTDPIAYNTFLERYGCDTNYLYGFSGGQYYLAGRMVLTFDAQDFITSMVSQSASGTPLVYENQMKRTYTYDANHNETEESWFNWETSSNSWVNERRYSSIYTAGNKTQQTTETWNTSTSSWKYDSQYDYTYTTANNVAATTYKFWDNTASALVNSSRTVNTYDGANNLTAISTDTWDETTGSWVPSFKETYTLNSAGNRTFTLAESWDAATSSWVNGSRIATFYYSTGLAETDTFDQWNTSTSSFEPSLVYLHNYDANGNELQFTLLDWNDDSLRYINREQITTTYNTYDQPLTYQSLLWDLTTNQWAVGNNTRDIRYYYELYTLGISNAQTNTPAITLYPVPARNNITLNLSWKQPEDFTVAILDMQGRVMQQWNENATAKYTHSIETTELPTGTYMMMIRSKCGSTARHFAVVR